MTKSFKPAGYASVSAYIVVDGAERLIAFATAAFDAKVTRRFDTANGTIMHAEVLIDDTIVMVTDGSEGFPAFPVWLHVYVPDVDRTYQKALAAGGTSV